MAQKSFAGIYLTPFAVREAQTEKVRGIKPNAKAIEGVRNIIAAALEPESDKILAAEPAKTAFVFHLAKMRLHWMDITLSPVKHIDKPLPLDKKLAVTPRQILQVDTPLVVVTLRDWRTSLGEALAKGYVRLHQGNPTVHGRADPSIKSPLFRAIAEAGAKFPQPFILQ